MYILPAQLNLILANIWLKSLHFLGINKRNGSGGHGLLQELIKSLAAGASGGLSGAVLSPGTPGPGEVPRRHLETVSPLSFSPPPLPLDDEAGLSCLSV